MSAIPNAEVTTRVVPTSAANGGLERLVAAPVRIPVAVATSNLPDYTSVAHVVELVIVDQGPDATDDWIADHIQKADICVTNDIPLAARCLERGAMAIRPNGEPFTENGIGMALANRELMQGLRESGEITGGPKPFSKSDRSEFLNRLETTVQEAKRVK